MIDEYLYAIAKQLPTKPTRPLTDIASSRAIRPSKWPNC